MGTIMSKLKPCPFCGEQPEFHELEVDFGGELHPAKIQCPKCKIGFSARPKDIVYGYLDKSQKDEAADYVERLWNRRGK